MNALGARLIAVADKELDNVGPVHVVDQVGAFLRDDDLEGVFDQLLDLRTSRSSPSTSTFMKSIGWSAGRCTSRISASVLVGTSPYPNRRKWPPAPLDSDSARENPLTAGSWNS